MKMFEIRRMEIVINSCDNKGKITSETRQIPITESEFNDILNCNIDWRSVVMVYLDTKFMISKTITTNGGLKYYDSETDNTCYVYLLSLTKKYI